MKFTPALALLALVASGHCQAEGFRPIVGAGFTFGGDKLATLQFTDGSKETIKSGGLLHLYGGVEYQAAQSPFALQGTFGYHVDDSTGKNASIKFQRWPVELLGFYQFNDQWRFGAGVRKATGAKFSSSGAASHLGDAKLTSKAGYVLQLDRLVGPNATVSVRYASEKYSVYGTSAGGNHAGIYGGYRF